MSFDPTASQSFVFANWTWNPERGRLTLFYRLDEYQFEEVIHFPGARSIQDADQQAALERCFELIHLLAGVSYYKAAVPARIEFETPAPPAMVAAFVERVYINGLGEFAFENNLQLQHRIHIPCGPGPEQAPTATLMPGTVVEVTATPRTTAIEVLSAHETVGDVSVFGTTLHVHLVGESDPVHSIREILDTRDVQVAEARVIPAGLEDAFLFLTRSSNEPTSTEAA